MTRRRPAGIVLALVMILLFVGVSALLAVTASNATTLASTLRGVAELEAHQAARFAVFQKVRPASATVPDWLRVSVSTREDDSGILDGQTASGIFTDDGLPDLGRQGQQTIDASAGAWPGHRYLSLSPQGLAAPRGSFRVTTSQGVPFAAVSGAVNPVGPAVDLDAVVPWSNPGWGQAADPRTAFGDTMPIVAARGGVQVGNFPYGFALTAERTPASVRVGGGAVILPVDSALSQLPVTTLADWASSTEAQIAAASDALVRAAQAADRTDLLSDSITDTQGLGMFFTEYAIPAKLRERLTLRESQAFFIPTVPGLTSQMSILYHVVLHMPDRPDGSLGEVARKAEDTLEDVVQMVEQLDPLIEALGDAQASVLHDQEKVAKACDCAWDDVGCWAACGAEEAGLTIALGILHATQFAVQQLEAALFAAISPFTDDMTGILAATGQMPIPRSRRSESAYHETTGAHLDDGGMDFWSYRAALTKVFDIYVDLAKGDWDQVGRDFGNRVNLVLFGQVEKEQGWSFSDSGMTARATWNVPRARTFYYAGDLTIAGDLWIGRGATLVVTGDLALTPGDEATGDGPAPTGRLFLEEGATLVVDGDFSAEGTEETGSVVLGSPMGAVHGITAAILCEGDVTLPHGVLPGVVLDELAVVRDGKPQDNLTPPATDIFAPLLGGVAPNLAKIDGPFWHRHPYVARYATSFEWITELDIPFVIPENFPNIAAHVFRGLSLAYAPTLNFELGENLFTHADWWGGKGEGRVPILLKPEAAVAGEILASSSLALDVSSLQDLSGALSVRSRQIGKAQIDRLANDFTLQIVTLWSKSLKVSTGIPLVNVGTIASTVLKDVNSQYYDLDQRQKDLDGLVDDGAWSPVQATMTSFWSALDNATEGTSLDAVVLVQECPGALVQAGGNLTISGGLLSTGWFVAHGDVLLDSRITVGSVLSTNGVIAGRRLFHYPPFAQASLFLPQAEPAGWGERALVTGYGSSLPDSRSPSDRTQGIGLWTERVTAEAWEPLGR